MNMKLNKTKKYDPKTRKTVRKRITQLRKEGKTHEQIAVALSAEGLTTPNGNAPCPVFIGNQLSLMRKLRKKSKAPQAMAAKTPKQTRTQKPKFDTDFMLSVLTNPEFSDRKKVRLMSAYFE